MNVKETIQSAVENYRAGNLQQAENILKIILEKLPNDAHILYFLGVICAHLDKLDLAMEYITKSLQFNPDNAEAHLGLAIALQHKGLTDTALIHYQKAINLNPNNAEAYNGLGLALKVKGQLDEAITYFQKALQINPYLADAYNNIGVILKEKAQLIDRSSMLSIRSFGGFEIAYRKNTTDEAVLGHSFDNDIFFSGVPEYQPEEGHVIIDIGAHIGTFSLLSSSKVGCGKVYAVEASEDSFNLLRINVALNQCANISVHHLAMADEEGTCTLYHAIGNWGHSTVRKLSKYSETVESCTLSAFLEKNRINKCHFIKLNCEGAEFPILLSTPETILQRIGAILVLYHCDLWRDNTEADLISHLESSGFNCVIRNRTEKRGWIIATKTE
jgi:FkbM family methyltransferase